MRIVSYIILGIIIIIFFSSLNFYNTGHDILDYPMRAFYHADMSHLIANGISFYGLSFMEEMIGSKQFLFAILFIWILSTIFLYLIQRIFPSRKKYTVGFSGVIFGLIVVYISLAYKDRGKHVAYIGLVLSIVPQLFMVGISFEGHLSGILAGIIYVLIFRPKDSRLLK